MHGAQIIKILICLVWVQFQEQIF